MAPPKLFSGHWVCNGPAASEKELGLQRVGGGAGPRPSGWFLDFEQSYLSSQAFCAQHGMSVASLDK
jgi:hypothetical protein